MNIGVPDDVSAREALQSRDWALLQRLWLEWFQYEDLANHPEAINAYRSISVEGRSANPILSLARAVAEATRPNGSIDHDVASRVIAGDALSIHRNWRDHESTDAAVLAGISYLAGQFQTAAAGRALIEACRIRDEIDRFIAERVEVGNPPSQAAATIFASRSAQLTLASAHPDRAAFEIARVLRVSDEPSRSVEEAEAVRLLSLEFFGSFQQSSQDDLMAATASPSGMSTAARLTRLAAALRLLDREAADRELAGWRPPLGEQFWSVRCYLIGARAALWGDAEEGLNQLDTKVAYNSAYSTEQHEPLGLFSLRRVRILLLSKLGAFSAALSQSARVPWPHNFLPLARTSLWAGKLDDAVHFAEQGLYEEGTWPVERATLECTRAAALR